MIWVGKWHTYSVLNVPSPFGIGGLWFKLWGALGSMMSSKKILLL